MDNSFGKTSEIRLKASFKDEKTYLSDVFFTAPFKIIKPFRFKDNGIKVLFMTASAGIMRGDEQKIQIDVDKNTKIMISSQSYEKIHKMEDGFATREAIINVEEEATLVYAPLPTIPFSNSSFKTSNKIYLKSKTSKLIFFDVLTCGRYTRGEIFEFDLYKSFNDIYLEDKLIIRDNMILEPKKNDLSGFGFFEGKTHLGTIFFCNFNMKDADITYVRNLIDEKKLDGGATFLNEGSVLIRIFANSSEEITDFFDVLLENFVS